MKKTRKCAFCGREFTANSGVQKYCSVSCADEAKRERKKSNGDFLKANIHHITKVHGIEKRKVGVKNLLLRADVERAMAERAAKGL